MPALQELAVRHAPLHAELEAASRTLITKFVRDVGASLTGPSR